MNATENSSSAAQYPGIISSRPSYAYTIKWNRHTVVFDNRLGAWLDPNHWESNSDQNITIVMQDNSFKNVVCKTAAFLCRPQCVSPTSHDLLPVRMCGNTIPHNQNYFPGSNAEVLVFQKTWLIWCSNKRPARKLDVQWCPSLRNTKNHKRSHYYREFIHIYQCELAVRPPEMLPIKVIKRQKDKGKFQHVESITYRIVDISQTIFSNAFYFV